MFSRYIALNSAALGSKAKRVCVAPYLVLCLHALMSDSDKTSDRHPSLRERLDVLNRQIGSSLAATLGARLNAVLGCEAVSEVIATGTALVDCFLQLKEELDGLAIKAMCQGKAFPRLYEVEGQAPGQLLRLSIREEQLAALPGEQRSILEGLIRQYAASEIAEAAAHRAN